MGHEAQIRKIPNSQCAVLMVHGILGTPNQFSFLTPLVPENWSIYNILLDGHGGEVEDFSRSGMKRWVAQTRDLLSELSRQHERIVVVGHSMGCLLLLQALEDLGPVAAGALYLAPALKIRLRIRSLLDVLRIVFDCCPEGNPYLQAMKAACSVNLTKRVWRYLPWIRSCLQLLLQAKRGCRQAQTMQAPFKVMLSGRDEWVSKKSGNCFSGSVECLEQSGHYYFAPEDLSRLKMAFSQLIRQAEENK